MILARKLASAVKLYRQGGMPLVADLALAQSRAYLAANPVLPSTAAGRLRRLNRVFNESADHSPVVFERADLDACRPALLYAVLRRQFFDAIGAVPDRAAMRDSEIPLLAYALLRHWDFVGLDAALPAWRARLAGTKFASPLDQFARHAALRLGRLSEAGADLPEDGDVATCLLAAEIRDAQGRLDEASALFARAAHRDAGNGPLRLAQAFHLLKRGRILDGFESWGLADHLLGHYPLRKRARRWTGEDIGGRTLLVIFEHGLGDMIQMARFLIPLRAAQPWARILALVPSPLLGLMTASFPGITFVPAEDIDPAFDLYVPSMQLPAVLGAAEPDPGRRYIRLDAPALPPPGPGRRRVGICWRGHPRHYELTRSIPVARFARLFERANTEFVVLLNRLTPAEDSALASHDNVSRPPIRDFRDLGALIAACDLVVSVDTAVPHVAAAAGRPVLLLSRPDACWRWGPAGRRSPWYDSVDVVRHPGDMDWDHVLADAAGRMDEMLRPLAVAAIAV